MAGKERFSVHIESVANDPKRPFGSPAFAAWPLAARAQAPRRVGVLMNGVATDPPLQNYVTAFTDQLRKLRWIDGKNLHIEFRWNGGDAALTRTYAAEEVSLAPDVILSVMLEGSTQ